MKSTILSLAILMTAAFGVLGQATPLRDAPAKMLSGKRYEISKEAAAAGIDGTFLLHVSIDESGTVTKVEIASEPPWPCSGAPKKHLEDVRRAIKENVLQAKFSPEIQNGKPYATVMQVKFHVGEAFNEEMRRRAREKAKGDKEEPFPDTVEGGVINGKALYLPRPEYPKAAKALGIRGRVAVVVIVGEDGNVERASVAASHPIFHEESRRAACSARFAPSILKGKAVKMSGTISYTFY